MDFAPEVCWPEAAEATVSGIKQQANRKSFPQRRKGAEEERKGLNAACSSRALLCAFAPLRENLLFNIEMDIALMIVIDTRDAS